MVSELDDLKRLLKAREGKYGSATSVALIKERIADFEAPATIEPDALPPPIVPGRYRSADTGNFVSAKFAAENPDTTYKVEGDRGS